MQLATLQGSFYRTRHKHYCMREGSELLWQIVGWEGGFPRWCTGKEPTCQGRRSKRCGIRWRGKWEGGSGWGIHVNPWLILVNVWQKPLQYCKVISLQLIKINEKKKEREREMWVWCLVRKVSGWRKWQPSPVFLPGKSHEQRILGDYNPWGSQKSWTRLSD